MCVADIKLKEKSWSLFKDLFPVYRTLMGEGFYKSLEIIKNYIPLNVFGIPSGTKCGTWTIPKAWKVKEAYIQSIKGKRIIDFNENTFNLWQYSDSFDGRVSKQELLKHISIGKETGDSVPLVVTYYKKQWGFSLSLNQFNSLTENDYIIKVDTQFYDGDLHFGELFMPGKSSKEILIDSVLSCSSLANNLTGVAAVAAIGEYLLSLKNRYYSYRILFSPETIGPIALHYHYNNKLKNVVGGYTLINLGYDDTFNYKMSRRCNSPADVAMDHALIFSGEKFNIEGYDVMTGSCGNEKAYNSLGIEVPIGAFRRSKLGSYPQYDTSSDNIEFIDKNRYYKSLDILISAINTLEIDRIYKHTFEGEPFLTGYNLYQYIENEKDRIPYDYLMGFTDGEKSLLKIAELSKLPIQCYSKPVKLMLKKKLIMEIERK